MSLPVLSSALRHAARSAARGLVLSLLAALVAGAAPAAPRPGSNEGQVPDEEEMLALQRFYDATRGDEWHQRDNWLDGTSVEEAASWYGVEVEDGDVVGLHLNNNHLQGLLPAELAVLTRLRTLNLQENELSGPLPAAWSELHALEALLLSHNYLTGSVPAAWSGMGQLHTFTASNNQLDGYWPVVTTHWPALQDLELANNLFTGGWPAALAASAPDLRILDVNANRLNGPLPADWPAGLESLAAGGNALTGPVPSALTELPQLRYLYLVGNQLSGPLPTGWGSALESVSLSHNRLSGPLPAGLGSVAGLRGLDLSFNRFTGAVPAALLAAPGLLSLNLSDNLLSQVAPLSVSGRSCALDVSRNYLDFAGLEALFTGPGQPRLAPTFVSGQRAWSPPDTTYFVRGAAVGVTRAPAGAHNTAYQWERRLGTTSVWKETTDPGSTTNTLRPTAPGGGNEAMEGEYRLRVANSWFPALTLYTRTVYLSQLPYAPLPYNEPLAATPQTLEANSVPNRAGQRDTLNYVRTYTARVPFTDPALLRQAPVAQVQVSTQYIDGLGRPVQSVLRQESPAQRDVIQAVAYDGLGRQPRQYLPYTATPGNSPGGYRPNALAEQDAFYRSTADPLTATLPRTGVAFAETAFEASPLNRVLAQAAAGETWRLNAAPNHAVTFDERANTGTDSVQRWAPGYGADREDLAYAGAYPDGSLWVKQTRDEQGQLVQEFTDPEGHVVLKKVAVRLPLPKQTASWLYTYYVYDDFGRLRAVLPPKAVQRLRANAWQVTGAGLEQLLFRYHYDGRGRLWEKLVPDTDDYTYFVYDALDRPVLSQDATQRGRGEWSATHYDGLGRGAYTALVRFPALTGPPAHIRDALQAQADAAAGPGQPTHLADAAATLWEVPAAAPVLGKAQYTQRAFPAVPSGQAELLTATDYDGYDFDRDGTADAAFDAQYNSEVGAAALAADARVTGQATRTQVRVLGTADWLSTTTFVDDDGRPVQVRSTHARGGLDVLTTRVDFTGKPQQTYAAHTGPNHAPVGVHQVFGYDHAGRLLETSHNVNRQGWVKLARQQYNELGQLAQKQLGIYPDPDDNDRPALQTVDYRYNIRGWLTDLNDASQPLTPTPGGDVFALALHYDRGFLDNQYNGNLSGQTWRAVSDNVQRAYGYRYDPLNRLLQGDFIARDPATGAWTQERSNYRFWAASYDAGGNLLTLRRRGLVQEATRTTPRQYAETDNLRYRYAPPAGATPAGNRLYKVDDLAPSFGGAPPVRPDFQDGPTAGSAQPDYTYDAAGALTSDRNKRITRIRYNHLHLPAAVTWATGDSLVFRYSAAGQKVAKLAYAAGQPLVRTDYLGGWQYEKDSLRWLTHAEGRALYFPRRATGQFVYEYSINDHLGNLRAAFRPQDPSTSTATMEPGNAGTEERQFDAASLSTTRHNVTGHPTLSDVGSAYVAQLNAAAGKPLGPLKMLPVRQGDHVDVTAYGQYLQPASSGFSFSLLGFVASLLQQPPPGPHVGDGAGAGPRPLPWLGIGLAAVPALTQLAGGVPKGYLRVLVFGQDSTLLYDYTQQLTAAAQNNYEHLRIQLDAPQDGYVQAYVGNESDADVYFDHVSVRHEPGLLVQENHYDPFGLELVGLSKAGGPTNLYQFNGKEKQAEFGLGWADHGWRFYDAALGRWVVTDPDAEEGDQESWGTYQFGLDNAVRYNDLDGRKPGDKFKSAQDAAHDFGKSYNGRSIQKHKEYGVDIYQKTEKGQTFYSYRKPKGGKSAETKTRSVPKDSKRVADAHTHGGYDGLKNNGDNVFSPDDKKDNKNKGIPGYVATPDGSLKKYDPQTNTTTTVATDLPSDANDPGRKNKIEPEKKFLFIKIK